MKNCAQMIQEHDISSEMDSATVSTRPYLLTLNTTYSKSRINFLEILRQSRSDYQINQTSLSYIKEEKFASKYYQILKQSYANGERVFENKASLENYYKGKGIKAKYAIKQIT